MASYLKVAIIAAVTITVIAWLPPTRAMLLKLPAA